MKILGKYVLNVIDKITNIYTGQSIQEWTKKNLWKAKAFKNLKGYGLSYFFLDLGRKLNVIQMFRRRTGHILKVLRTFNLYPVSR